MWREQIEERERQWQLFHEWEAENLPPARDPSRVLADLSFLLRYISLDDIARDPDPDKQGIAQMRAALTLVSK